MILKQLKKCCQRQHVGWELKREQTTNIPIYLLTVIFSLHIEI